MSAPCRSSKARLPPLSVVARPCARRISGWSSQGVADAPSHQPFPGGGPKISWPPQTTFAPEIFLKTPERPLANGRDRPALITRAPRQRGRSLLELDFRSCLFQSSLDLLGLFLAHAFLDGLRRGLDQVLGFLQAERSDGAHFLDPFDLLV